MNRANTFLKITSTLIISICLTIYGAAAHAAINVAVNCTINGNDVVGESSVISMDREGSVEVYGLGTSVHTPLDPATGIALGGTQFMPVRILKRVDSSTIPFIDALVHTKPIDCTLRFFDVAITEAEILLYTVTISNGYVVSVSQHLPDREDEELGNISNMREVIGISYQNITWSYDNGGTSHSAGTLQQN